MCAVVQGLARFSGFFVIAALAFVRAVKSSCLLAANMSKGLIDLLDNCITTSALLEVHKDLGQKMCQGKYPDRIWPSRWMEWPNVGAW